MANSHQFDDVVHIIIHLGIGNWQYTICINSLCTHRSHIYCPSRHVNLFQYHLSQIFKRYLLWTSRADGLEIWCEASWVGSLPKLWKLCRCSNFVSRVLRPMGLLLVCYYRCIRHSNRPDVKTLSPLTFMDWLALNFMWGILMWVSTKVMEIMIYGVLL